jgi:hypothetical protein
MAKRLTYDAPKLVGKPLHGEPLSSESARAEQTKRELQIFLKRIQKALNEAHFDIEDLQEALGADADGNVSKQIHPFLTMGA